jgi:hypothetical protein
MSEKDAFAQREHWLEEEYFRKRNQELLDKIHQQQALEVEREHMGEMIGVQYPDLLGALQDLGFHEDTLQLLHIVPLVQVAWVEGSIAEYERDRILQFAFIHGILPGSTAYQQLTKWLSEKPSEQFFENTLHAIGLVFEALPQEQRETSRKNLINYCNLIAASVGRRLLGLPEVSKEERMIITHIAEEIGRGREDTVRQVIGG